ncbi:hypothetical protein Hanom_Chr03g00247141 [Helianthus anomalus]
MGLQKGGLTCSLSVLTTVKFFPISLSTGVVGLTTGGLTISGGGNVRWLARGNSSDPNPFDSVARSFGSADS